MLSETSKTAELFVEPFGIRYEDVRIESKMVLVGKCSLFPCEYVKRMCKEVANFSGNMKEAIETLKGYSFDCFHATAFETPEMSPLTQFMTLLVPGTEIKCGNGINFRCETQYTDTLTHVDSLDGVRYVTPNGPSAYRFVGRKI